MEAALMLTFAGLLLLVVLTVWTTRTTHMHALTVILVGYLGVFLFSAGLASFGMIKHHAERDDGKNIQCAGESPRFPACPPVNET